MDSLIQYLVVFPNQFSACAQDKSQGEVYIRLCMQTTNTATPPVIHHKALRSNCDYDADRKIQVLGSNLTVCVADVTGVLYISGKVLGVPSAVGRSC